MVSVLTCRFTIFGRMNARLLSCLTVLVVTCGLRGQALLDKVRIDLLNGRVDKAFHELDSALTVVHAQSLQRCRLLEAKGEVYHRLSDIGEAQRLWTEALLSRQALFGDSSAEAAVGYAFQARYHNFMAAPHIEHHPLAWREAMRARRLLVAHRGQVSAAERILIARESGYAYKVAFGFGNADEHAVRSRSRELYREALRSATSAHDTIWMAQVIHDIGNTFNDEAVYYGSSRSHDALRLLVDSALHHYGTSIALMERIGMGTSEAVMMDHFTTALLLKGVYGMDSLATVVAAYDRALRTMLAQVGYVADVHPLLYDHRIVNKAQMVELLYLRATAIANYPVGTDAAGLRNALRTIEAAVPYWNAMLSEYTSRDFHKVVGSYSHFPFRIGTRLLADLYRLTGDASYLQRAVDWFDRNRNALEQREMLRHGADHLVTQGSNAPASLPRMPEGVACIALHEHAYLTRITIGPIRTDISYMDKVDGDHFDCPGAAADLLDALENNDPRTYRRIAYAIYRATIADALADPNIHELVIIPGEALDRVPFEALVTDTLGPATWGTMHYVIDRCVIRYARTIREALLPAVQTDPHRLRIALAQAPGTSALPFAEALIRKLGDTRSHQEASLHTKRLELLALLSATDPVHFASHAVSPSEADAIPYLLLTDGHLTLHDLDSAQCHAPLVVLSTCSSGEGRRFYGEGLISLGNALLRSGAGAVVQTLWRVDDQATSEVLEAMYQGMDDGVAVAEALTQAKRAFLARHREDALSSPFYWSGVVMIGREVRPATERKWWLWVGGCAAIALAGLGYRSFKRSRRSRALPAS